MYFDVCGWNDWYAPVGASLGNEWRIGPDDGRWDLVLQNINIDAKLPQYAGPGMDEAPYNTHYFRWLEQSLPSCWI